MQKYYLSFLCFISSGIFLAAYDLKRHKIPLFLNSKASKPTKEVPKPSVMLPASGEDKPIMHPETPSPEETRCANQYVLAGIVYKETLTRTDGMWTQRSFTNLFTKLLQGKIIWVFQESTERQAFICDSHPDRFVAPTSKSLDPTSKSYDPKLFEAVHSFRTYHLKKQRILTGLVYEDYSTIEYNQTKDKFTYRFFTIPIKTDGMSGRHYIIPEPTIPEGVQYEPRIYRAD